MAKLNNIQEAALLLSLAFLSQGSLPQFYLGNGSAPGCQELKETQQLPFFDTLDLHSASSGSGARVSYLRLLFPHLLFSSYPPSPPHQTH